MNFLLFLLCKLYGHSWDEWNRYKRNDRNSSYYVGSRYRQCTFCKMQDRERTRDMFEFDEWIKSIKLQ